MGKVGVGAENVGVLRRAEDLASTYVLRPRYRNQLSSISECDGQAARDGQAERDGIKWCLTESGARQNKAERDGQGGEWMERKMLQMV